MEKISQNSTCGLTIRFMKGGTRVAAKRKRDRIARANTPRAALGRDFDGEILFF